MPEGTTFQSRTPAEDHRVSREPTSRDVVAAIMMGRALGDGTVSTLADEGNAVETGLQVAEVPFAHYSKHCLRLAVHGLNKKMTLSVKDDVDVLVLQTTLKLVMTDDVESMAASIDRAIKAFLASVMAHIHTPTLLVGALQTSIKEVSDGDVRLTWKQRLAYRV